MKDEIIVESKSVSKKKEKKKDNNTAIILIISILLSFVCGMFGAYLISQTVSVEQVVKNITTSELVENSISSSVDKVYGSTVAIIVADNGIEKLNGTGFIYKKKDGLLYIITNNHVIENYDTIKIEFIDNSNRVDAKVIGGDKYADIAVLTIKDNDKYQPVEIGDNSNLKLGDTVFTVGMPEELTYKGTVTKGILSGKDRIVSVAVNNNSNIADYYMKLMQTDAAINPGNSGGPLCDVSGKVIGINSSKIVKGTVESIGFAIPIEEAMKYASIIEKNGKIVWPYIGVSMLELTNQYALWQSRIMLPEDISDGVVIADVENNSAASKGGLKKGDVIVSIGGEKVRNIAEFRYELYRHEVGEKVEFEYYRDNKIHKTTITPDKSK